jgi:hypothetical protein
MTWTYTNVLIQAIAGACGGLAGGQVFSEYRRGVTVPLLVGLCGGFLSGWFLQHVVMTVVTGSGVPNEVRPVEAIIFQVLSGTCVGAIVSLGACFMLMSLQSR